MLNGCTNSKKNNDKIEDGNMKQKLVLIPGVGGDDALWKYQINHLSDIADITVVNLDKCKSREEMVEEVLNSVEGSFAMAGISMGGWVGMAVASTAPDRVTKFAAICTWARPMPETEKQQREILKTIKNGHYIEWIEEYLKFSIEHARGENMKNFIKLESQKALEREEVFTNHLEAYLDDFQSVHLLPKIKCPTLVIAGKNDPIFSVDEHQYIAESINGAKLAIIDDCAHFIPIEQPQALSALMRYWIKYY
jgi:pimeloyl-ACP methyl ester carboxylesterase